MAKSNRLKVTCALFFCVAAVIVAPGQTFTTLVTFDGTNGSDPVGSLIQGIDGNFYGVTGLGGNLGACSGHGCGTVFEVTTSGKLTTLYKFCSEPNCSDGSLPLAGLVLGIDGNFYGTASGGGANEGGTVFKLTAAGKLTTLYSFCAQQPDCTDGGGPAAPLIQAQDGNFYGTTFNGGSGDRGCGVVFKISPHGEFSVLRTFKNGPPSGCNPAGPLAEGNNGLLYGTTVGGGVYGGGLVFMVEPSQIVRLYSFCSLTNCVDGRFPQGGLMLATDGNFYGTTEYGGSPCQQFSLGCGTVFQVTSQGKLTTIHSFCSESGCADGYFPFPAPLEGTDGNLYGTTQDGGNDVDGSGGGAIFETTTSGVLSPLYDFCSQMSCSDGASTDNGMLQGTDGNFYGTASAGGPVNAGTVFVLSTGLAPFVSLVHNPARVGQAFGILGQDFIGTTAISLNGAPVSFEVRSSSLITASVPSGATTGYVTVTTPSGVLTSNVPFHVIP